MYTDGNNHKIRKISEGIVTTIAGDGMVGYTDGTAARFNEPRSLAIDNKGNLLVADCHNHRIRIVHGVAKPRTRMKQMPDSLTLVAEKILSMTMLADLHVVLDESDFHIHTPILLAR